MGEVVDLKPVKLEENHGFVQDCCRFQEGILTEANMRLKYRSFTDNVWQNLGSNEKLLDAVEEEKIRRIRTGQQKREKAQGLIVKAPTILDSIMSDASASPRHRVDAIKTLDGLAANPQENTPAASGFFQITINLGADHVEHYSKSIAVDPNDGDPNDGEGAPQRALPAVNKPWDSDDVVAAPAKTPIKTIEHGTVRLEDKSKRSPYDIALAALMERG